jgi:ribose-phosphate pyrophosphokinase
MKLFTGKANEELGKKISHSLNIPLSKREIFTFPDGETRVQAQERVVNEHVIVIQPTSPPVDSNYLELFFLADALKRAGAKHVTAIVPYLGYQRQDHVFRDGEAVSLEVMVKTMEAVGIDDVIAFDLHSIKIPEVFTIPIRHLSALPLFAETILNEGWTDHSTRLVTPDMGGIRRIEILSNLLSQMPYSCIVKDRDLATGHVEASGMEGDVADRMLIVDDMISSGGTIVKAAEYLSERGAKEIYVFATHAIFSKEAPKLLQNSLVKKVFITDSVYVPKEKQFEKLEIISIADMIATSLKEN